MQLGTDALFALLDFCGIRQRDVVQYLGVSKALVSQWRSGRREMGLNEYYGIIIHANRQWLKAMQARIAARTPDTPLDESIALLQELEQFRPLWAKAWVERSPALLCELLKKTINFLEESIAQTPDPRHWDPATLEQLTTHTETLVSTARMLRSLVSADPAFAEVQAQTEARLDDMMRALQEAS
jgi:hypothetical protein